MALETVFTDLSDRLAQFQDALHCLSLTVAEDRPANPEAGDLEPPVPVEKLDEAITDAMGWLSEARQAARHGLNAARTPVDWDRSRRALATCHQAMHRVGERFALDMISYERIAQILRLSRGQGGEWFGWGRSVKTGLEQCRTPLRDVDRALFHCWQEMAERAGAGAISVTAIGQQVTVPDRPGQISTVEEDR